MREHYGDAANFLEVFKPELQLLAAREWVRAYTGKAPTLSAVIAGYGEATAEVWLCLQLENVNLFAGVKEKMPVIRQRELSKLIMTEYAYLRVSELLLFFHRLKCGKYGRFYGSVDALFIASALLGFMTDRRNDLIRIEDTREKEEKKAKLQTPSGGISYTEYLAQKKSNEENQNLSNTKNKNSYE